MSNLIHVLLSEAGELEAGPTEFDERLVYEEAGAEKAFSEMEKACECFIEGQIEIINSNEEMRNYNEMAYGAVGGGYFYLLCWLAFPDPPKELTKPGDLIAHYLGVSKLHESGVANYLRRQVGYKSDSLALETLAEQFCDGRVGSGAWAEEAPRSFDHDEDRTSADVPRSRVGNEGREEVQWLEGPQGPAKKQLATLRAVPVPETLLALPRLHPGRPRGSKAMLDAAGAKRWLAVVRPGAWLVSPLTGWKWAKWPGGEVGWVPASVELPEPLRVDCHDA